MKPAPPVTRMDRIGDWGLGLLMIANVEGRSVAADACATDPRLSPGRESWWQWFSPRSYRFPLSSLHSRDQPSLQRSFESREPGLLFGMDGGDEDGEQARQAAGHDVGEELVADHRGATGSKPRFRTTARHLQGNGFRALETKGRPCRRASCPIRAACPLETRQSPTPARRSSASHAATASGTSSARYSLSVQSTSSNSASRPSPASRGGSSSRTLPTRRWGVRKESMTGNCPNPVQLPPSPKGKGTHPHHRRLPRC